MTGVRVGHSPSPNAPSLWQAAGARCPCSLGAGGCGPGNPSPGTGHEGARTRRLVPPYGVSGVGHTPSPNRLSFGQAAGARCPLSVSAGGAGVGTRHQLPAHALASWRCALCGQHEGAPRGRLVPPCGVSRVKHSPSPDRPSLGQAAGACCPFFFRAGGAGKGTRHQPHSARSCEMALRAVG